MGPLIRIDAVMELTKKSRAAIYRESSTGTFCKPIRLGPRAVAWIKSEVDDWMEARKAERDNTEQLGVRRRYRPRKLVAQRSSVEV